MDHPVLLPVAELTENISPKTSCRPRLYVSDLAGVGLEGGHRDVLHEVGRVGAVEDEALDDAWHVNATATLHERFQLV